MQGGNGCFPAVGFKLWDQGYISLPVKAKVSVKRPIRWCIQITTAVALSLLRRGIEAVGEVFKERGISYEKDLRRGGVSRQRRSFQGRRKLVFETPLRRNSLSYSVASASAGASSAGAAAASAAAAALAAFSSTRSAAFLPGVPFLGLLRSVLGRAPAASSMR